jgi:hypothetical protein
MAWEVECMGVGFMVGDFDNRPFLASLRITQISLT